MFSEFKLIIYILNKSQRKNLILLLFMLLIGMLFEILGIGLLFPILTALTSPEKLKEFELAKLILDKLSIISNQEIIKFSLFLLCFIYTIKSIYLLYLNYFQNRFISNLSVDISNKIFHLYINSDYSFHIKKDSSELVKNFQVEVNGFFNYLNSYIQLLTESILAISVIVTLLFIETKGTILTLFFFGILSFIFNIFAKNKSLKWGKIRAENDTDIAKIITEGLSGIKEILILGRQFFFFNKLEKLNRVKASLNIKSMTLRQVPRYYLELLAIFALVIFIFILVSDGKNIEQVLVVLGVFVGATFRLLPSINRILSSLQNLKFHNASLEIISNEMIKYKSLSKQNLDSDNYEIKFNEKLVLNKISFYYQKNKSIINNLYLEVFKGQTIGIIGTSGAGKTTLVNIISGLLKFSQGEIIIDKNVLKDFQLKYLPKLIGYVPQEVFLTNDTIESNIAFGVKKKSINRSNITNSIERAQLKDFVDQLPNGIKTKVGERGIQISGGQKQRIGIARALYNNPEIIILDEATSALDEETEDHFMKSIYSLKRNKTIIIITHRLRTLKNCDKVYELKKGNLNLIEDLKEKIKYA